MGFTSFEKRMLQKTLRDRGFMKELLDNEYPQEIVNYLKNENLLGQVRDYAIISNRPKLNKPENLTMTYVLDAQTFVYDILQSWQDFLSPPVLLSVLFIYNLKIFQFHIQMDCSLLLIDLSNEFRFNWAQVKEIDINHN